MVGAAWEKRISLISFQIWLLDSVLRNVESMAFSSEPRASGSNLRGSLSASDMSDVEAGMVSHTKASFRFYSAI